VECETAPPFPVSAEGSHECLHVLVVALLRPIENNTPSVLVVVMEAGRMVALSRVNEQGTVAGFSNETGSVEEAAVKDNKNIWDEGW